MSESERSALGDSFDRVTRNLTDLPDTVHTEVRTIRDVSFLGISQDWTVQTYRQRDIGDTILVTLGSGTAYTRLAIPPAVARAIAAQYDSLSKKNRKRGARQAYETKVAAGVDPAAALRKHRKGKGGRRG